MNATNWNSKWTHQLQERRGYWWADLNSVCVSVCLRESEGVCVCVYSFLFPISNYNEMNYNSIIDHWNTRKKGRNVQ